MVHGFAVETDEPSILDAEAIVQQMALLRRDSAIQSCRQLLDRLAANDSACDIMEGVDKGSVLNLSLRRIP